MEIELVFFTTCKLEIKDQCNQLLLNYLLTCAYNVNWDTNKIPPLISSTDFFQWAPSSFGQYFAFKRWVVAQSISASPSPAVKPTNTHKPLLIAPITPRSAVETLAESTRWITSLIFQAVKYPGAFPVKKLLNEVGCQDSVTAFAQFSKVFEHLSQ